MKNSIFFSSFIITLAFSLKMWVIEGYTIPTASMQPTLTMGDKIWIKKLPFCPLKKGEIVAFKSPETENVNFVKRCIGLPNDSISLVNGKFTLQKGNSKAFAIPQKGQTIHFNAENFAFYQPLLQHFEKVQAGMIGGTLYINNVVGDSYTFSQNYFYMLGDNQEDSYDSRNWGLVPESFIIGKAFYIWKK